MHVGRAAHGASAARQFRGNAWYSWVNPSEYTGGTILNYAYDIQTNEQPFVDYGRDGNASHSLGQLWAVDPWAPNNTSSTVELGWSESLGQFGDVQPHLFIAMSDAGVYPGGGYVGNGIIPWVQSSSSAYPNMAVAHSGGWHSYAVWNYQYAGNWWVYYDGQWLGYIPPGAWHTHFPAYMDYFQAGGEVATGTQYTCTDMGNGQYGTSGSAAQVGQAGVGWGNPQSTAVANLTNSVSDPNAYNSGNWSGPNNTGYSFRYGGNGWC